MAIVGSGSFTIVNAKTRLSKGKLVRVELEPGRFVKMYEADVARLGLGEKGRPQPENKMREPADNKAGEQTPTQPPPKGEGQETLTPTLSLEGEGEKADDLTSIDGVGKATARALALAGVVTFEQLRTADLTNVISGSALAAVEAWRQTDG